MIRTTDLVNDELIIFYDGYCPLCSLEMKKLKQHDAKNLIVFEDLQQENFEISFPHISYDKAMNMLHGQYKGDVLLALDVTHRAWTIVGKGLWVAPLKFPIFKQIAHLVYLLMAKYRQPISSFMHKRFGVGNDTRLKRCEKGVCYDK